MKFRKIVATLLAAAVMMTSSFTATVSAAEVPAGETAVEEAADTTDPAEGVLPGTGETGAGSGSETQAPADVTVPEEVTAPEEGEDTGKSEEGVPAEEENKEGEEEVLTETEAPAETEETETAETEEIEGDGLLKSTDYFEVEAGTGKLKRKQVGGQDVPLQEDVKIPANCKIIPAGIFQNNRIVKTIRFDKSYENAGQPVYKQELITIEAKAFENSAIEEIIGLPSGVTAIPNSCFVGSNLKYITYETDSTDTRNSSQQYYSKSIQTIGDSAFNGVRFDRTSLEFYGCTSIETSAFEDSNITEIRLRANDAGQNIATVGNYAFRNCSKLEVFGSSGSKWPATITTIGTSAFEGTALSYVDLSDISLAAGLNPGTFKNCKKLTSFVFQKNATVVPNNLFNGCSGLKEVAFPEPTETPAYDGITEIEYDAFYNCTALAEISLRKTNKIGQTAFGNCTNLKNVYFNYPVDAATLAARSIPDSAFYNNLKKAAGFVMHGYDDDFLMPYASKHNYKYETLNKVYKATKSDSDDCKYATITVSPEKILPGEKVTVTVKPSGSYSLIDFRVLNKDNLGQIPSEVTLESFNRTQQVFSFEMPLDANYDLIIKPIVKKTSEISLNNLEYYLEDENGTRMGPNAGTSYRLGSGEKYQIVVRNAAGDLPKWLWTYTSDRANSVAVTSTGVLSTLTSSTTPAFVTAKMMSGSGTVKFKVEVNDVLTIKRLFVKGGNGATPDWIASKGIVIPAGKNQLEVGTRTTTDGNGNAVSYPLVRIARSLVEISDYTFDVNISAYTANTAPFGDPKIVKSNWTSTDATIAAPVLATSTTNNNTVKIKKGSSGETAIGITTLNFGETKVNGNNTEDTLDADIEYNETFVILEVWDDTPRIAEKEIVINAQKSKNLVTLFNSYADDGDNASGKVYEDGMFKVYYDRECTKPCKDFTIEYDKDSQRMNIVTTEDYDDRTAINKTNNYKGLWLDVTLHERGKYIIPLPNVKIENKPLAPKLTSTGKLNLFYNTTYASINQKGRIRVNQSLTGETLDKIVLVSTDNYKKYGKRAAEKIVNLETMARIKDNAGKPVIEDKFHDNFTAAWNKAAGIGTIERYNIFGEDPAGAPEYIYTDRNGKAIVAGYIYLFYDNYKYPAMQVYTVPTEVKAPDYYISPASMTTHTAVKDSRFKVKLYEKGTNRRVVGLFPAAGQQAGDEELSDDGDLANPDVFPEGLALDADKTTNKSVINNSATLTANKANDEFTIGIDGTPTSGLAVIRIHMKSWSDFGKTNATKYLRYNYNITAVSTDPRVTANASSVNFNLAYKGEKYEITYNSSLPVDAPMYEFRDLTYTGPATNKALAETLKVTTRDENGAEVQLGFAAGNSQRTSNGKLKFELPMAAGQHTFAKGSYTYKVTPVVRFAGTTQDKVLAPITFTVSVVKNNPTLRLTNSTFTINYLDGLVTPAGDYTDTSYCETKYTLTNLSSGTVATDYTLNMGTSTYTRTPAAVTAGAPEFGVIAGVTNTNPLTGSIYKVSRVGGARAAFNGYQYNVSGATITTAAGATATLDDFKITVKGVQTEPVVTIKTVGSLNFPDRGSAITCDFTIKNVQGTMGDVDVYEIRGGSESTLNFDIADDPLNPNRKYVFIKEPHGIQPNTTYKLRFRYALTATGAVKKNNYYVDANIRTAQTFPKVTATYGSRNYIYAGEDANAAAAAELDRKLKLYVSVPTASRRNFRIVSNEYQAKKTDSKGDYVNNPVTMVANGVRWAPNTPENYKRAFDITDVTSLDYAPQNPSGVYSFELKLKNAAAVPQNKELTLNFQVFFQGQAINTAGVPVSYKITVRK